MSGTVAFRRRRACEICDEPFTLRRAGRRLTFGRHHCRLCGISICDAHFVRPRCTRCQDADVRMACEASLLSPPLACRAFCPPTPLEAPEAAVAHQSDPFGLSLAKKQLENFMPLMMPLSLLYLLHGTSALLLAVATAGLSILLEQRRVRRRCPEETDLHSTAEALTPQPLPTPAMQVQQAGTPIMPPSAGSIRSNEGVLSPAIFEPSHIQQQLVSLRAVGEAVWGGGLPVVLDDDHFLLWLLRRQRQRRGRDREWASRKLRAAISWRRRLLADFPISTRADHSPSPQREELPAVALPLDDPSSRAAPRETHTAVRAIPNVLALLRGPLAEPCLSDRALIEAGRVLRGAPIYWHGYAADGVPIMWANTGQLDLRMLGRPGHPDAAAWGRAIATLVEVGLVGVRARSTAIASASAADVAAEAVGHAGRQFYYIECSYGLRIASGKTPIHSSLQVAKACTQALFTSAP